MTVCQLSLLDSARRLLSSVVMGWISGACWPVTIEHFSALTFGMKIIYHGIGLWEKSVQAECMSLEGYLINPGHRVPTPERFR